MSKILLKTVFLTVIFSSVLFSSCHGVIFDTIRDEVKLEKAQVTGDIHSIVRQTVNGDEYLFVQNGKIYRKLASKDSSGWENLGKPESSSTIVKLAADANYLYALALYYKKDSDEGENVVSSYSVLYSADGGITWADSDSFTGISSSYSPILFCTNSVYAQGRYAYIRSYDTNTSAYAIYQLNGSSATLVYNTSTADPTGTASTSTLSCAYFNGNVYFSNNYAIETNGTSYAADDADIIYTANSDTIYWEPKSTFTGSFSTNDNKSDVNTGVIYSMALTADYIVLGTSSGIKHASLPLTSTSGTSDFSTNAETTLSSYYEIYNVLAVEPGTSETAGILYGTTEYEGSSSSTSATFSNVGLWAYYASRGSWNRE